MLPKLRLSQRNWNWVLIVAISLFMLLMAAPDLIKQYLLNKESDTASPMTTATAYVLNPEQSPVEINYPGVQLYLEQGDGREQGQWPRCS